MTKQLYEQAGDDHSFKNLLLDILHIFELTIDESDNDELKTQMNYSPVNTEQNEEVTQP